MLPLFSPSGSAALDVSCPVSQILSPGLTISPFGSLTALGSESGRVVPSGHTIHGIDSDPVSSAKHPSPGSTTSPMTSCSSRSIAEKPSAPNGVLPTVSSLQLAVAITIPNATPSVLQRTRILFSTGVSPPADGVSQQGETRDTENGTSHREKRVAARVVSHRASENPPLGAFARNPAQHHSVFPFDSAQQSSSGECTEGAGGITHSSEGA